MATAHIRHQLDKRALFAMLHSPSGTVAQDLFRRGKKVEAKAKRNLNDRAPRRINTGALRSSINTQLGSASGKPIVRVGSNLFYAVYVHEGTGIYGPNGRPIRPKRARALSWKTKGGKRIFARQVKGMRPNRFLADAIMAAKD